MEKGERMMGGRRINTHELLSQGKHFAAAFQNDKKEQNDFVGILIDNYFNPRPGNFTQTDFKDSLDYYIGERNWGSEEQKLNWWNKLNPKLRDYLSDRQVYAKTLLEGLDIPNLPLFMSSVTFMQHWYDNNLLTNTLAGVGKPKKSRKERKQK